MQTPISKRYLNLLKIHFYAMFKVWPGIKVITGRHEPIIIVEMAKTDMSIIDTYDIPGFYGCLKVLPCIGVLGFCNIRIEVKKTRMDEILAGHIKIKTKVEKQLFDISNARMVEILAGNVTVKTKKENANSAKPSPEVIGCIPRQKGKSFFSEAWLHSPGLLGAIDKEGGIDDTEIEATLRSGINTLKERRKKHGNRYGNVYKQFGKVLLAHFPGGIHIGPEDYDKATKLGIIVQCLTKSTRYCAALDEGGHKDSAHDLMNYGAMLESLTKK